jgi:lysophospholipase L1-like esterase
MKKMKYSIFSIAMVLLLAACNANGDSVTDTSKEGGDVPSKSSEAPINENFTLIDPSDTSMVSSKVKAYVDAMKEVCEYYAIPVLDLFATSGIQPQLPIIYERYTVDGLHPNAKGHRLMAERIAGFLKSL